MISKAKALYQVKVILDYLPECILVNHMSHFI